MYLRITSSYLPLIIELIFFDSLFFWIFMFVFLVLFIFVFLILVFLIFFILVFLLFLFPFDGFQFFFFQILPGPPLPPGSYLVLQAGLNPQLTKQIVSEFKI